MRRWNLLLIVLAVCLVLPAVTGRGEAQKSDQDKVKALMRKKLEHSQKILEGLTAAPDYKMISSHAEELMALSKEAEWKVIKTPRYEVFSNDFRNNCEDLIKAAKDKNIDAASLAYVDLTITCVKCHKHVREERMTSFEPATPLTGR
jgi:hypothetical protein